MRNLDRSVFRRRYLNEEMELDMTKSVGRKFHTDNTIFILNRIVL